MPADVCVCTMPADKSECVCVHTCAMPADVCVCAQCLQTSVCVCVCVCTQCCQIGVCHVPGMCACKMPADKSVWCVPVHGKCVC